MKASLRRLAHFRRPSRWTVALLICLAWGVVVVVAVAHMRSSDGLLVATLAALAASSTLLLLAWNEHARWHRPIHDLIRTLAAVKAGKAAGTVAESPPEFDQLRFTILDLVSHARRKASARQKPSPHTSLPSPPPRSLDSPAHATLTKSGLMDASPVPRGSSISPYLSGEFSTTDMINRLEPIHFHWIESSHAEQVFLGWQLAELQAKSFLDILHPADRSRARELFEKAIAFGDAFGLVVRAKTGHGRIRAIEVNVGARYGPDQKISHLRCHLTDVTAKVQAERERHLRNLELTRVNAQLRRINRELEQLKDRLAQTNSELSQKNRELDEFVHVVSHDLQEPLRTLIAFSDFLVRDYGERIDGEGQEYIHYIIDASRRMRAMINGLLNLSRLGKVIGDFADVNLNDVVAVVIADLRELIRAKAAHVSITGQLPTVSGDHGRISQLFTNLISNALKYNRDAAPRVEIGAITAAELLHSPGPPHDLDPLDTIIYVKDNGIGIDRRFHRTIFQLFRRLHTHEEFEGTGVGLSLCIKIVQAHGGTIWLDSDLGHGATFFVSFPGQPAMSPAAAGAPRSAPGYEPTTSRVSTDEHQSS